MSDPVRALILLLVLLVYFLPSMVAIRRERSGGVIILNVFWGWTLVGWFVALTWAMSLKMPRKTEPEPVPIGRVIDRPTATRVTNRASSARRV